MKYTEVRAKAIAEINSKVKNLSGRKNIPVIKKEITRVCKKYDLNEVIITRVLNNWVLNKYKSK